MGGQKSELELNRIIDPDLDVTDNNVPIAEVDVSALSESESELVLAMVSVSSSLPFRLQPVRR